MEYLSFREPCPGQTGPIYADRISLQTVHFLVHLAKAVGPSSWSVQGISRSPCKQVPWSP